MDQKDMNKTEAASNKKQKGASLVEYALLVALIAVVCIVAIRQVGTQASATFTDISSQLSSAN